jgi:hypothetical protein
MRLPTSSSSYAADVLVSPRLFDLPAVDTRKSAIISSYDSRIRRGALTVEDWAKARAQQDRAARMDRILRLYAQLFREAGYLLAGNYQTRFAESVDQVLDEIRLPPFR